MCDAADLVGAWELVAAEYRAVAGDEAIEYLGASPRGSLIYTADGGMSVQLAASGRPRFASGDRLGGSDDEVRAAFEGYHSYFGRYSVDAEAGHVVHEIQGCSYPNFEGTSQTRYFELKRAAHVHGAAAQASAGPSPGGSEGSSEAAADVLTLTTSPLLMRGRPSVGCLVWRRLLQSGGRAAMQTRTQTAP